MNIEDIVVWLQWLQYLSLFRYGLNVREVLNISILTFYVKFKKNPYIFHVSKYR